MSINSEMRSGCGLCTQRQEHLVECRYALWSCRWNVSRDETSVLLVTQGAASSANHKANKGKTGSRSTNLLPGTRLVARDTERAITLSDNKGKYRLRTKGGDGWSFSHYHSFLPDTRHKYGLLQRGWQKRWRSRLFSSRGSRVSPSLPDSHSDATCKLGLEVAGGLQAP